MNEDATVLAVNTSLHKGEKKRPVPAAELRTGHGINGDAHAGPWHRQVSLLADEDIALMRARGLDVTFGDFAENITTRGINLPALPVGTRLQVGSVLLEVTQIGKKCHHDCEIFQQIGSCVMPSKGIFARVLQGGTVRPDDRIRRCA